MPNEAYGAFIERVRELFRLRAVESLLHWDQEVLLPRRGAADRAHQVALLAGMCHDRLTCDEFGALLEKAERAGNDGEFAAGANLREVRRIRDRAMRVPGDLVRRVARATALGQHAWKDARAASDFAAFAPHLSELLDLKRQVADCVGWKLERYDALLDEYEPGTTAADVQAVFAPLKGELVSLLRTIAAAKRQPDMTILQRGFPKAAQTDFVRRIVAALGFDFDSGRLDTSTHPFCSGFTPADVRLTTRYDEKWLPCALFGTMHEAGHGMYEQGFDAVHAATPMAAAVSLGIHESQSRMWENLVGRSRPFWEHWFPVLAAEFPSLAGVSQAGRSASQAAVSLDDFYFAINAVRPSLIRVEADEVTYNLHIMQRFQMERALVAGTLAVNDVPEAWNESMRDFLGVTPPNDAQGCLQDIHWSAGLFGYFPTYALGNLYAAQFFAAARRAIPALDDHLRGGETKPLLDWLREKIHRHGMRYRAGELVKIVTGQELSHRAFMDYLNAKFRPLYRA